MLDQLIHLRLRGQAWNPVQRMQSCLRHRRISHRSLHLDDFRGEKLILMPLRLPPFLRRLPIRRQPQIPAPSRREVARDFRLLMKTGSYGAAATLIFNSLISC